MYPEYVDRLIEKLEDAGFEAFVVGGGLRDALLGKEPSDFDLATSATPNEMLSVFSDMKTIPTGIKHGTLTVLCEGNPVEITTYRLDEGYEDSRHPLSVSFTANIHEDLARRDFTVNALAYNKRAGLIDDFGGQKDLEDKILRAVGDPVLRMKEDALRIMRALRFSAQLGFEIEKKTEEALSLTADGLDKISAERKASELAKLISAPFASNAVRTMNSLSISQKILLGYRPSDGIASKLGLLPEATEERLALLLWEAGDGKAADILRELKYSNAISSAVLKILSAKTLPSPKSDAEIRAFLIDFGELSYAISRIKNLLSEDFISTEELQRIEAEGYCKGVGELDIDGNTLIELGFRGKEIGDALGLLLDLVTKAPKDNTKEKLTQEAKRLKENK